MIEAWGGILNLILYAISMLGLGYYAVLTVFSPNTLVTRYDLGEKSVPIIRIVGSFVLPTLIIGVWIIFRENGPLGCWIFFVFNFLVSLCQVILSWGTRLKIIDPDSKNSIDPIIIAQASTILGGPTLALALLFLGIKINQRDQQKRRISKWMLWSVTMGLIVTLVLAFKTFGKLFG